MQAKYFCIFDGEGPHIADVGEPIVLINARLNAGYGGTTDMLAEQTRNLVRHQVFHVFFARFRALFAYGIDKVYGEACARDSSLPMLDETVRRWAREHKDMLAAR